MNKHYSINYEKCAILLYDVTLMYSIGELSTILQFLYKSKLINFPFEKWKTKA